MNAKNQKKKDELIADLIRTRQMILTIASSLPTNQQDQVFLGIWSVKHLLAHVTGWDVTNFEAIQAVRKGKLPAFYAFVDHDWKTYNAMLVSKYKKDDFKELISSVQTSHRKLIDLLETIPAEEYERDTSVRFKGCKVTIARLLQAEIKDMKVHYDQIVAFRNGDI